MSSTETVFSSGGVGARTPSLDHLQQRVNAAAAYGLCEPVALEVLAAAPLLILLVPPPSVTCGELGWTLDFIVREALYRPADDPAVLFRSVELTRLSTIIQTGCDVVPPHAPLYASDYPSKALEYGGANKVILVLDPKGLQKTFKKVRRTEAPEILDQFRSEYPTEKVIDEEWLWFSKLPAGDGRIGTAYETNYSFFIPGNPHEALLMLFLVGNSPCELRSEFKRSTTHIVADANLLPANKSAGNHHV